MRLPAKLYSNMATHPSQNFAHISSELRSRRRRRWGGPISWKEPVEEPFFHLRFPPGHTILQEAAPLRNSNRDTFNSNASRQKAAHRYSDYQRTPRSTRAAAPLVSCSCQSWLP